MGIISKVLAKSRLAKSAPNDSNSASGPAETPGIAKLRQRLPLQALQKDAGQPEVERKDLPQKETPAVNPGAKPVAVTPPIEIPAAAAAPARDRTIDTAPKDRPEPRGQRREPPADQCRIHSDLISLCAPDSPETELFKVLRNKILFPREGTPPRSIMVTSAMSGEGKSFVAANLAVNLAKSIDQHVLLMDCDLREPCVHRKFGFGEVMGLSEYLANGTSLAPLLLKTEVQKLTLLPAGTPPENPAEILSSVKMDALMDELLARYDDRYIIIDAPPPLIVPDTSAIVKKVDGIVLVVHYGKTDFGLIEELIGQVGQEKIIGAVINRSKARSSRRYAYNRYRKYGKYSRQE
jgi:protein-tyrosine kinase